MSFIQAEVINATKRYGPVTALDHASLSLASGEITALLGPNGAGKTTLVRLLLGLIQPSEGKVRLFGRNPVDVEARQRVGVMLQTAKVPETLTVAEHIRLFSSYYPSPMPLGDVLAVAGLADLARRRFGALSGGERQRVLFALAICGNPDLLLLDEPTVGLDVESRRGFLREIRGFAGRGCSMLLTTHYLEEAEALADRVIVLQRGRIIADGALAEIKQRAASVEIRCVTTLDDPALATIPGVSQLRRDRETVVLTVRTAETAARELLARDPSLSDLEITRATLEDAFVALTNETAPLAEMVGVR